MAKCGYDIHEVRLDVGGIIFRSTASTLCSFGGYFQAMLGSGAWNESTETGKAIFIDRGPVTPAYLCVIASNFIYF